MSPSHIARRQLGNTPRPNAIPHHSAGTGNSQVPQPYLTPVIPSSSRSTHREANVASSDILRCGISVYIQIFHVCLVSVVLLFFRCMVFDHFSNRSAGQ